MITKTTVSKLHAAVIVERNNKIDGIEIGEEVILDEVTPENLVDLLCVFEVNPSIKSVIIEKVSDINRIDPHDAEYIEGVVSVNTMLRCLDFGDNIFPKAFVKPFLKVFQQFCLDKLSIICEEDKVNEQLAYYKNRNAWLWDVCVYYINQYIQNYEKGEYGKASDEMDNAIGYLKQELALINKFNSPLLELEKILNRYTDLSQSNNIAQKAIISIRAFLRDMKNYCVDQGDTPIHFLVYRNKVNEIQELYKAGFKELINAVNAKGQHPFLGCVDFHLDKESTLALAKTFINFGVDINTTDNRKTNIMHSAAEVGDVDVIDFLYKNGADINKKTKYGVTPIGYAMMFNQENAIKKLESLGAKDKDAKKIISRREMFYIFGQKKLEDSINNRLTKIGGYMQEAYLTFNKFFGKYVTENSYLDLPDANNKFKQILLTINEGYKNLFLSVEQMVEKINFIKPGERHFLATGNMGHAMGASIEVDQSGDFILSLSDRGEYAYQFMKTDKDDNAEEKDKFKTIKQINVPNDKLKKVIELLYEARFSDFSKAEDIIFNKIPAAAQNKYVDYPDIEQPIMKLSLCYFSNPLTMIYLEIMNQFGNPDKLLAKKIYKDFTTYMRNESSIAFSKFVENDEDKALLSAAEKIVADKKDKLKKL